ncbi:MAG: helix-turn-helix domain-containing protein [Deltaproteobacteria bacterium]|nr:helix-turn-helix domain-containing protein [Deltaproteobacteria bacterium]
MSDLRKSRPHEREPGAGFGHHLKRLRETRGITLEEIGDWTKIRVSYLEALEREDMRELPAPIFTKGFIKNYCRCLSVDDKPFVLEYVRRVGGDGADTVDLQEMRRHNPAKPSRLRRIFRRAMTGREDDSSF